MLQITLIRWTAALFVLLLLNTAYIAAFPSAGLLYTMNVILHVGLGLVVLIGFCWLLTSVVELRGGLTLAASLLLACAALGIYIAVAGVVRNGQWARWAHAAAGYLGCLALLPYVARRAAKLGGGWLSFRSALQTALIVAILLPVLIFLLDRLLPGSGRWLRI